MRCLFTWSKVQYSTVQYSTVQYSTFSGRWDVSWHGASDGQTWRKLCCRCRTWMAWLLCVFSGEGARHVMSRFITFLNLKISKKRISGYWQYLNSGFSKQFCRFITEIFLKRWQWGALPCAWSARQTWRTSSRSLASCRRRASPRCESWCGPSGGWTWRSAGPDFTSFTFTAASIYSIKVYDYVTNVTYMQYICNVYCIR